MHQFTVVIVSLATLTVILTAPPSAASTIIRCPPSSENVNPALQAFCETLELKFAEQGGNELVDNQLFERGAKRQDVDHVFLRFGRRQMY